MSSLTSASPIVKRIPRIPDKAWPFMRYVWRHLRPVTRWQMIACLVLGAVTMVQQLAVTWIFGRAVSAMSAGAKADLWERLTPYLIAVLAVQFFYNATLRFWEWVQRRCLIAYPNEVQSLLFNRLQQQSQGFLHNNFAGVLANHVRRGTETMVSLFERVQNNFVPLAMRFIGTGFLLWQITPWFALLLLAFVVLAVGNARWLAPIWAQLSQDSAEAASRLSGYIVDATTNLTAVQQNAAWPEEQRRLETVQGSLNATWRRRQVFLSWYWGGFDVASAIFFALFMAVLAYGWQRGDVDNGQLAMATALVGQMFVALSATLSLLTMKMDDIGILRDSLGKIATPIAVLDAAGAPALAVREGRIAFEDMGFAYPNGQGVFDRLRLEIAPGQSVGLVGVSGAGKTTLCQLLLRAYDPQAGRITIDGQDIAQVTQDSLRAQIAVIPQEPMLFHRTLAENIAYGRPSEPADMARVRAAAQAAQADHFIDMLPQGYDTLVGERGIKLSGGQRQRVAIARAIYKDAPILLLDEATSALDSETERDIQQAMIVAMKGRTTLVVAHRLSTISHLDRIVVMEQGRVVEDGDFHTLLAQDGIFARLWNLQAGGFIADHL